MHRHDLDQPTRNLRRAPTSGCGRSLSLSCCAALLATACGEIEWDGPVDAPVAPPIDATLCPLPATLGDLGTVALTNLLHQASPRVLGGTARIDAATEIRIEAWEGAGVFSSGYVSGSNPIAGAELQYRTCGSCLLLRYTSGAETDVYFQTGGTTSFTSFAPNWAGELIDVALEHVTIDASNVSTPVGDCTTRVQRIAFDVVLPPAS